jgi:hypothetical protein
MNLFNNSQDFKIVPISIYLESFRYIYVLDNEWINT